MNNRNLTILSIVVVWMVTAIGCDEDEHRRRAEMAEKQLERQAEQHRQMAELQQEVAEGARQLVEADAKAREEMVAMQRDLQESQIEVGRQRDQLESERRSLATQRRLNPIIAAAITNVGLLLACLLPLALCWYLLRSRVDSTDDNAVTEVLLQDLVTDRPLLLPQSEPNRAIALDDDQESQGDQL